MASHVVVTIPSRGRPAAAAEAVAAIRATATQVATEILVVVDADDPELSGYRAVTNGTPGLYSPEVTLLVLEPHETGNLVKATNTVARRIAENDPEAVIGNLNDDHRTRSEGWDKTFLGVLGRPGLAYGDDLIHGKHLPSAPFVSAELVRVLGWFFLPLLEHNFVDDAWRELAVEAGVRHYVPEVTIEHLHPAVGKGEWDEGYRAVQRSMLVEKATYHAWRDSPEFTAAANAIRMAATTR